MTTMEDMLAVFLEHGKDMSMCGTATGSMWLGLRPLEGGPSSVILRSQEIIKAVMRVTEVAPHNFYSARRDRSFSEARQLAYWFLRHFTSLSLPQIGRLIGDRDHSTVLHGIRKVDYRPKHFAARINGVARILMIEPPVASVEKGLVGRGQRRH